VTLQEQRDAVSTEQDRKLVAAFEGLKAELTKRKIPFDSGKSFGGRYDISRIDGEYVGSIEIRAEQTAGLYPKVGRVRIIAGKYHDNKRQFVERKDGFNFAEIVDDILQRVVHARYVEVRRREDEKRREQLEAQVERIQRIVGEVPAARVQVRQSGGLHVEADRLSEEQALRVMQLLQSFHSKESP